MTLVDPVRRRLLVMRNDGFTIGMLVAFQMFAGRMSQPMLRLVGLWQEFQQANIAVQAPGRHHERAGRAVLARAGARRRAAQGALELQDARLPLRRAPAVPLPQPRTSSIKPGRAACADGRRRAAARARSPSCCRASTSRATAASCSTAATSATSPANELRQTFGVVPQETRALLRHDLRQPRHRQPARRLRAGRRRLQGWPRSTTRSSSCRRATRPRSASTASASPAARSSASRSRARCSSGRRS